MAQRLSSTMAIAPVALVTLLAAGSVTPAGAAEPSQPTLQSRDGRWTLVRAADAVRVRRDVELVERLPLAAATKWSAIASLQRGWVAAAVVDRGERSELTVLASGVSPLRTETAGALAAPPTAARLVRDPVLFVAHGRLVGLAWLEGADIRSLEVRAATWDGTAWGAVERVAGRAAGSQMALTGDVLEDGSWLVAWAAYDGADTEILWSRRAGDAWSPATRLHRGNAVHDIVPVVVAAPGGALVAWSRFDGNDYRLRLARFDGSRWRRRPFTGGRGSLRPAFVRDGEAVYLLYREAAASVWKVAELDRHGRLMRQAVVPEATTQRPLLAAAGGPELVLRWPGVDGRLTERRAPWEPRR